MKTITVLLMLFLGISAYSQENIPFLSETTVIEGAFDHQQMSGLKTFTHIYKSNDSLQDVSASYFIGYNAQYLYLYIEAQAELIIHRDRGYQNGDGFHLTIAKPNEDGSPSDEFYVLGFSPTKDWSNKIRWYYNIGLSMSKLPGDVQFETAAGNGKISFELLIPWRVVKPYHPWLSENIGFNLCFVKAVNDNDKIYYFITPDDRMQSEQSKREYVTLKFEDPASEGKIFALPVKHNISLNQNIEVNFCGYFKKSTQKKVSIEVVNENQEKIYREEIDLNFNEGLSSLNKTLQVDSLTEGCYNVMIYDEEGLLGESLITVINKPDFNDFRNYLSQNKTGIKPGTYNTVQFYINEYENEIKNLKYYESSKTIVQKSKELSRIQADIISQTDPFAQSTGVYRRAFQSSSDSTYRPYSVYIPQDYSPDKTYPLLVYLHGSGEDDRALLRASFIKEGFIVLAPNGRGTSNCFASSEAQLDIQESIADVLKNFRIDTHRIILSGFSMGGYGVYRTYYQYPEMFSAIAVISGHPNLASKWGIENAIDFLDDEKIKHFASVPIFIFHGKNDLNCPFNLTIDMVERLKKLNDKVVFVSDESAGHGGMKPEIQEEYFSWLLRQKDAL